LEFAGHNQGHRMKSLLYVGLGLIFASLSSLTSGADPSWPHRPIRILIGFPPGGGGDGVARVLSEPMARILKQPVVVENRPGAGTTLATSMVVAAPPDGYTLLMASHQVFGPEKLLFDHVKYDETSFTPISSLASTFFMLAVNKDLGVKRVSELLAKARQTGGAPMFVAVTGGIYSEMNLAYLNKLGGTNFVPVPYKGGAPAVTAVVAGQASITFAVPTSVMPLAKTGRITALGITSLKRSPLTPGVPTLAEEGLEGFNVGYWFGLMGPAKVPNDIVQKLFEAASQTLAEPAVQARFANLGYETTPSKSVAEFRAVALRDGSALAKVVQSMGLKGN
jgi:tripartite-type tricarboxylate transporter receptor subunit TctC